MRPGILLTILILSIALFTTVCTKTKTETTVNTGNIEGKIIDKINAQPILAAEVKISGSNQAVFSGADGSYKFISLSPKEYQITVSKQHYLQETKPISVIAGQTANLDFALAPISLAIAPSNQTVDDSAGTIQFTVTSNISWTAAFDQPWCSIDHTSGIGNAILTVTYQANTTLSERTATLTVAGNALAPETVTITQLGGFPTNGLLAYYPFNGNANDESGNRNNGTVLGAALTTDRHGNPDKAYNFNGINNYINIRHTSALMLIGVDFTISAWVTHAGINDFDKTILVKSDGANIQNKWIFWYKPFYAPRGLGFEATDNGNQQDRGGYVNNIVFNEWYHYCMTKTATELKFYINGVLVYTDSYHATLSTTAADVRIGGAEVDAGVEWWLGKLDDIGIWNRALSSSEVAALYQR
jgi:hypothetical protein